MIKLNVERMRRNMARSTPDVVYRVFDKRSDTQFQEYQQWLQIFAVRMSVKHGHHVRIEVHMDTESRFPNEVVIDARVVKEK